MAWLYPSVQRQCHPEKISKRHQRYEYLEFIPTMRGEHDLNAPMADFDPSGFIGRTFLKIPEDNGEHHRARILEVLKASADIIADKPEMAKFQCSINNGASEEIVTYNDFLPLSGR